MSHEGGPRLESYKPELARYLTSIISSPLAWIHTEEAREVIWDAASARLSERAGRTAAPSLTRTFYISRPDRSAGVAITLREPALTEDNLGHKTWGAGYMLARRLLALDIPLLHRAQARLRAENNPHAYVLELGAGTGLAGLALATCIPSLAVHLTDLPAIVPNLSENVKANSAAIEACGSTIAAFALDWSDAPALESGNRGGSARNYDLVLAADPIYEPEHPKMLVDAIVRSLSASEDARVVIELPLREGFEPERRELWQRLMAAGLFIEDQGEEDGFDDWGDGNTLVHCQWSTWARRYPH